MYTLVYYLQISVIADMCIYVFVCMNMQIPILRIPLLRQLEPSGLR